MELLMSYVSVRKRRKQILSDVSAALKPGINAIIGESGAGKTAVLRSIAGLQKYEGCILKNKFGAIRIVYQPKKSQLQKRGAFFENMKRRRLDITQILDDTSVLWLLDEPMIGMKTEEKENFRNMLLEKKKEDPERMIFISSNEVQELESICDRVMFLHKGRLLAYETKEYLYETCHVNTLEEVFEQLKQNV